MDILINNPISHMYGPHFLWFYGAVIFVTVTICKLVLQGNFLSSSSVKIPDRPDPYELAYLRDGEKAVIKLVCFELVQQGYLQVKNDWIERYPNTSDSDLKPIEKSLFNWILKPRTARDLTTSVTLKNAIAQHCQTYQKSLEDSEYLIFQKSKQN